MPTRARRWFVAAAVVMSAATVSGCVAHPVGSARNSGIYAAKATRSAESALSAVQTVRLVAGAASDGNVFGTYASVAVDGQEDLLTSIAGTFRSIRPPTRPPGSSGKSSGVSSTILSPIAAVRIDIRSGRLATAADVAAPLSQDAEALSEFVEANE